MTEPLGIAEELHFGVPESEPHRVASLVEPEGIQETMARMSSLFARVLPPAIVPTADFANRADVLTADIPSGGTTSAHGIAKMYAALLAEVDGVRLIGPEGLELISATWWQEASAESGQSDCSEWRVGSGIGQLRSRPGDLHPARDIHS